MKYILTTSLLFALFFSAFSQEQPEAALKSFEKKAYYNAAIKYNEYIDNQKNVSKSVLLNAADANFYIREYRQAALYYERAFNFSDNLDNPFLFRYVNSLRRLRESDKANSILLEYYKLNDIEYYNDLTREVSVQDSLSQDPYHVRYDINNLSINTSNSEFSPVHISGNLFYTSSGKNSKKATYAWNNQPYLSLFKTTLLENESYSEPEKLSTDKSVSFHEATIAFHPNDGVVYFSANSNNNSLFKENKYNSFKLYKGIFDGDVITNVKSLYFNSNFYSVGHPTISKDGKYLFFASDMPNGYGQADIYYVEIYDDGLLGSVKNAGPLVNTMGNDFFPHLKDDRLYFASDGHLGFGGLDLFNVTFSNEDFRNRTNLGKGINTNYDEFAIYYKNEISGYFSSNRPMGKGDDDIYSFKENRDSTCVAYYKINVLDRVTKKTHFKCHFNFR